MDKLKQIKDFLKNIMPDHNRLQHLYIGLVIFIVAIPVRDYFDLNQYMPLITVCIAAFLNEVYDFFKTNSSGFDIIDFIATVLAPLILTYFKF